MAASQEDRAEEIREAIFEQARAVEPNSEVPGEPTLVGILQVAISELARLMARVEQLEQERTSEPG